MVETLYYGYEYVGFLYNIIKYDGDALFAAALPNQHKAAYKHKHARAAADMFKVEYYEQS